MLVFVIIIYFIITAAHSIHFRSFENARLRIRTGFFFFFFRYNRPTTDVYSVCSTPRPLLLLRAERTEYPKKKKTHYPTRNIIVFYYNTCSGGRHHTLYGIITLAHRNNNYDLSTRTDGGSESKIKIVRLQ